MIRRDFLKKIAVAVIGLTGIDALAEKLVAREVEHKFGVIIPNGCWAGPIDAKGLLKEAWGKAKVMLDKEHKSSLWKGVFIPNRVELVDVACTTTNEFSMASCSHDVKYNRYIFKMKGIEVGEEINSVKDAMKGAL